MNPEAHAIMSPYTDALVHGCTDALIRRCIIMARRGRSLTQKKPEAGRVNHDTVKDAPIARDKNLQKAFVCGQMGSTLMGPL